LLRFVADPVKAALRHADDGNRLVTDDDFLADHSRIQIESGLPEWPAHDGNWGVIAHVHVFGTDRCKGCEQHREPDSEDSTSEGASSGQRKFLGP
jgi:hypothetical protein